MSGLYAGVLQANLLKQEVLYITRLWYSKESSCLHFCCSKVKSGEYCIRAASCPPHCHPFPSLKNNYHRDKMEQETDKHFRSCDLPAVEGGVGDDGDVNGELAPEPAEQDNKRATQASLLVTQHTAGLWKQPPFTACWTNVASDSKAWMVAESDPLWAETLRRAKPYSRTSPAQMNHSGQNSPERTSSFQKWSGWGISRSKFCSPWDTCAAWLQLWPHLSFYERHFQFICVSITSYVDNWLFPDRLRSGSIWYRHLTNCLARGKKEKQPEQLHCSVRWNFPTNSHLQNWTATRLTF